MFLCLLLFINICILHVLFPQSIYHKIHRDHLLNWYPLLHLRQQECFWQNDSYETSCSDRALIRRKFA